MANDGLCWLFTCPTIDTTSKLVMPWKAPYPLWKARSNYSWKQYGRETFLPSNSWIYLAQRIVTALDIITTATYVDNIMWNMFSCWLFIAAVRCCQRAEIHWSKGSTRHSNPTGHRAAAPMLLVSEHVGRGPSFLAFKWKLVFAEASVWPRHKPSLF